MLFSSSFSPEFVAIFFNWWKLLFFRLFESEHSLYWCLIQGIWRRNQYQLNVLKMQPTGRDCETFVFGNIILWGYLLRIYVTELIDMLRKMLQEIFQTFGRFLSVWTISDKHHKLAYRWFLPKAKRLLAIK